MPPQTAQGAPGMRLSGITTVLDDTPVLHRLALDVPSGSVTVLMGPSGGGKTTLVRHIAGLLEPDRGSVEIGGRNVWEASKNDLQQIRKGMSVLLGGSSLYDTSLFGSMNAYQNVEYGLKANDVPEADRERRTMARLEELGLGDVADKLPDALPAHARRRLALARALATDAPLLILDDIDVGLDAAYRERMIEALAKWRQRTHGTMLITTHSVSLARELGENLAVLGHGRILQTGPASQLLDGVESNEQFGERFLAADFLGPPSLEDVEASAPEEDEDDTRRRTITVDPTMVRLAAVGAVLLIIIMAYLHFGGHLI